MTARAFVLLVGLALSAFCGAALAQGLVALTPLKTSVEGGQSKVFTVRFGNARPSLPFLPQTVVFANDACGTFPDGGYVYSVVTDSTGVASVTFTASPNAGITCWLTAKIGPSVITFDVITYRPNQVNLQVAVETLRPGALAPGNAYRLVARPMMGAHMLRDVTLAATVIPRTGTAVIAAPSQASTGQQGLVNFEVTADRGNYEIEVAFGSVTKRLVMEFDSPWKDYQGLWWSGLGEDGWGMSVAQHGDTLFNVIYAYDDAGRPTWYVMPGGTWNAAKTAYSGPLFSPRGSPFHAYEPAKFVAGAPVGDATITFSAYGAAQLDYAIGGVTGRKAISHQVFGPSPGTSATPRVADMWWGGSGQNGWGIAVLQQFSTLFAIWFHYDEAGRPTWATLPGATWTAASQAEGRLYRTTSSPWLGVAYDPFRFRVTEAGAFRLRFDGAAAILDYTLDGRTGSLPLARQPF